MFVRKHYDLFEQRDNTNRRAVTQRPLVMPTPQLKLYKRNCVYMTSKIYNKLPKLLLEKRGNAFSNALKEWLAINCFYSIEEILDM